MRSKTLFGKLFLYNISVVILSMVLTSLLLYAQLGSYFKNAVYTNLRSNAEQVSQVSSFLMDKTNESGYPILLSDVMGHMGHEPGQGFILIDKAGRVIFATGFVEGQIDFRRIDRNLVEPALMGVIVESNSTLGGALNAKHLSVMVPIMGSEGIEGAVVLCSTENYSQQMQLGVMHMFTLILTAVIFVTLIVSAVMSKKVSSPVKEMTSVAKKIASGDFSQRVSIDAEGELGQLATTFNQMSVALEEMDEMQSAFISDVSHELRTPMTIISGFVEGVLDGTIPENEHKKYLEIVLGEIKRLNRLVNDLLEMSRLNSGKIEYKMVPFDVTSGVRKAIVAFEKNLSEKGIDVEVDFENDSMFVLGNSDSIYRVITNIMDNAVKFTPENGKITIRVKKEGNKIKTSIENTGKGLSEKELGHIWDRFYQTDKSRSNTERKGVGLGLYIVRNIMLAHNNDIYAESEEGKWTRFTFELNYVKNK